MVQPRSVFVLASLLVLTHSLPHSLEYDKDEDIDSKIIVLSPNYLRQAAPVGGVLGALGTALVPVVGALIGPILTNLAAGITQAFNNGVNSLNNGTNNSTATITPKPTRPKPNRRPSRPSQLYQLDISTDGLPEFEGFMIRLPGVDRPYLLLAPPGSDLSDLPFKLEGGREDEDRLNLSPLTSADEGQVSAAKPGEHYEQTEASVTGFEHSRIKIKRSDHIFKTTQI